MENTGKVILLLVIAVLYLLPTLMAFGRGHPRRQELAIFNVLLGWTLIGWIIAFLWAALTPVVDQTV